MRSPLIRACVVGLGAGQLLQCGGSPDTPFTPPPPPAAVASLEITPATDTLTAINAGLQFTAVARDSEGTVLLGRSLTWSTSDSSVVTMGSTGLAKARGNGTAEIRVQNGSVMAAALVLVSQEVASIVMTPDSTGLPALATAQQFTAIARDENFNTVPGAKLIWSSSDSQVVTVDSTGLATAQSPGLVTITAEVSGVSAIGKLTVVQVPIQLVFISLPASIVAGAPLSPAVEVEVQDATGHRVTTAQHTIVLGLVIAPGGAPLGGTTTINASAGVATFSDLHIDRALGGYMLGAFATTGQLIGAYSPLFSVAPDSATQVVFTWTPDAPYAHGQPFFVDVQIQDPFGNVVPTATNTITVSLSTNPTGSGLGGTKTVSAVNGIATFSLSVPLIGTGYVFQATSPGFPNSHSLPFNVQ